MPCYSPLQSHPPLIIHLLQSQDASSPLPSILFHPHLSFCRLNTRTKTFSTLCHKLFRRSGRGLHTRRTCCIPSLRPLNNVCIALKVGRSLRVQSVYLSSHFEHLEDPCVALSVREDGLFKFDSSFFLYCTAKILQQMCVLGTQIVIRQLDTYCITLGGC